MDSKAMAVTPQTRGRVSGLGGAPTLAAGAAFLILLVGLFVSIWLKLAEQNDAGKHASTSTQVTVYLRQLLQGVNETAVTEGAAGSKAITRDAITRLDGIAKHASIESALTATGTNWPALKTRVEQFLGSRDFSTSNVEVMISLGKITTSAGKLAEKMEKDALEASTRFDESQQRTRRLILAGAVAGVLGLAGIFYMFYRRVTKPLKYSVVVAEKIAGGDLAFAIDRGLSGETRSLMQALGHMQTSLARLVRDVRDGTHTVSQAANEMTTGSIDLSVRTEQQAATLEETAASMEELTGTVQQTAANTKKANEVAASALLAAREGGGRLRTKPSPK